MKKKLLLMILMIPLMLSLLSINTLEVSAQETHDIAVISVIPSPTSARVGELVNITVVVENQGTRNETFNTTVYANSAAIETKTIQNLTAGTNTSLTFTWDTTDTQEEIYTTTEKEKTYTINATASTIPGETDIEDNTLASPSKVKVISQYITIAPQSTVDPNLTPGKNYTISIYTDYNGTDIWGWQFILNYDPNILHGVKVINGELITNATHPGKARFEVGTFNNTLGKLSHTVAYFSYPPLPVPTTNGPGILANVTFTVVGYGTSDITLGDETKLKGYDGENLYDIINDYKPRPNHLLHGFFQNMEVTRDIAVISVIPSPTSARVGELVNITVVVENQGTRNETFDVTVFNSYLEPNWWNIGTETVPILEAGKNTSLTFAWNATKKGTHTIKAVASTLPGEEDTEDNTLVSDDTVTVTLPQRPSGLPIELIAIVVVIVVIGAVAAYVVIRRRKPTPE